MSRKEVGVYLTIVVLLCGLLLAAFIGDRMNHEQHAAAERLAAESGLGHIRSRLEVNLHGDVQLVKGLVSLIATRPHITQNEFARAAKPLFEGGSNLRNIGAAPDMVMRMMYPMAGNEKAIGLDFRKTPGQFETADRARTTGHLILAGPLKLVQGGNGIIGRLPVFVEDKHGSRRFWGLISAVIDADRLFQNSGLLDENNPLEIAIRGKDGRGSQGEVFFGRPELFDTDPVLADIALPNGSWQIAAVPRGGWPTQAENKRLLRTLLLVIGLLILLPLFALARSLGALVHAQKRIVSEQGRLLATLENTPNVAVQWYDRAGRVIYWNLASEKLFGWTSAEVVGKTLDQIILTREQTQQFTELLRLVAETGDPQHQTDTEIRHRDGSARIISSTLFSIPGDAEPIFVCMDVDVTDRKQAEQELKQSKDQLAIILNATTESIFHVDENGIILAINEIGAQRVQKEPQDMIGKCAFDYFPPEVAAGRRESLAEVFRTGKEIRTEDTRNDRFYALSYYPVIGSDGKAGSVVVYAADITERRLNQLRLEHLLAEQKTILENDLIGIVTVKDRNIVWANPAFERMLGYGPGELVGTPTSRNYPSDEAYQAFGNAAYPVLSAGKIYRTQFEQVRKDGRHIWLDVSGANLESETGESLWGFIDITERKHAEIALEEQKNFLTTILENEPECVKVIGADGKLLQMNAAGLSMLEAGSVAEVNERGLIDYVMPEHRIPFKNLSYRIFRGETGVLEFEVRGKQGTRRWLETHAAPLRNTAGKITYLLGVTRDVTRRREAEERLSMALKGADLAMTDWHIPSDMLYFGEGWTKLLGYQADELPPHPSSLARLIRPEDALYSRDILIRHLKGETPYIEAEVRMQHKDGHWVWVLARGMAVERSADGRAVRVTGTAMDISSRKQAESEIARLSQWNELLLNSAGEGIYGVDRNGRCTFINPAALAILGFSKEEVLGKNQHIIFHHHHKDGTPYPSEDCPIFKTLHDGIRRGVEDAFIRKNGEVFPVQLTVTPMHENGQIVGVEAVFQDIAQRKEMEEELIRLATTDSLTGMANRRHFIEQLEMELAHFIRFGQPTALLMVDIDHFKSVNDTYGHATGDIVLRHFAELAGQRLRRVDLLGRLGGEEFGILLPGTDSAGAKLFAERFRNYVADTPAQSGDGPIPFTISIGIAMFDSRDEAADSIMARADMALYRAKAGGRNRVELSRQHKEVPS
ncbi:MAG: PAS domain S-box protein [Nitrosomonadales bacterium]|nr:PAS domain S-box protein [Nitrosomonadales bacterium]